MEKKTALLCDSSADVTEEEAKELGIHVLRMPVIIEGKEYLEGVSVFDSDILEALRAQKKITTTQPSAGEIMRKWEELLQDHDEVFYLPLSRALSGTCANAIRLAKERYEGRVTVVDSTFVCYPVIYMLKAAREMLEKGYTCAQIKEKIENEGELFAMGFTDFRVRWYAGAARLQFPAVQLPRVLERREEILAKLKKYYPAVLLDLEVRG